MVLKWAKTTAEGYKDRRRTTTLSKCGEWRITSRRTSKTMYSDSRTAYLVSRLQPTGLWLGLIETRSLYDAKRCAESRSRALTITANVV